MRKTLCYCDICRKEIEFYEMKTIKIIHYETDDTGWKFDFCLDCWNKIGSNTDFLKALKIGTESLPKNEEGIF